MKIEGNRPTHEAESLTRADAAKGNKPAPNRAADAGDRVGGTERSGDRHASALRGDAERASGRPALVQSGGAKGGTGDCRLGGWQRTLPPRGRIRNAKFWRGVAQELAEPRR